MQGVAAGAAAVALVGGGFVTASLGSVGVPEAQAAVIPSTVGYTEAVYTASYPSTFLGAVAASSSDAKKAGVSTSLPWWCYDWATANNRKVSASSVSTFASADAALVNYVIQNYQDTPANHPAIAAAVHLKLDQGRAKNTKGQWGYDARRASGTFKKRIDQAKNMLAAAADRRGPYKLAPAVALSSDKKSITLTETYIKTAVGKNLATFNSKAVQVTATISGNAVFSNGKKSITFNAGAKQTLKVTGTGKVTLTLASAKVLPAGALKKASYNGRTQDKYTTGGLMAAKGSKALTVPALPAPKLASVATDQADGDKTLAAPGGVIKDVYSYTVPEASKAAELRVSVKNTSTKATVGSKSVKFTPAKTSGSLTVQIPVGAGHGGAKLSATAELWQNGKKLLTHNAALTDAKQTVSVTPPSTPDMGTTARTLIEGKADDDKQLDYVYGDPSWAAPRWVAPEQIPGSERQGDLTGLSTTGQDGTAVFDPSKAEVVDQDKGIYKDASGALINKDGYLVNEAGELVLETRQGYFERTGTSAVTAQVDDVVEYGKKKPATDYIGTTGTLRTTIKDKATGKDLTKALTGKETLDFTGKKITAKRGTWNTGVITVNLGQRQLTQRLVPQDQSGNGVPDWAGEAVTTDTDDSLVTTKTTWVFFEDYLVGGKVLFSHNDIKSTSQSFAASNPLMTSNALDPADGDKDLPFSGGLAKDTVSASGLSVDALAKAGAKFRLDSSFFDHHAGVENTAITASKAVEVADQKKNTWSTELNIPAGFEGRELTFYARLIAVMPDGTERVVIDHTNKDAASQTITLAQRPTGHTLAVDAADGDHYLTEEGGEVDETLSYTGGWDPKEKYTFVLQGVEPGTGKELPTVKLTAPFVPDVLGGQAKFKVEVPSRAKLGADGVAFDEKVIDSKGNVVFSNKNKDNPSETVYLPKIGTVATNTADGSKEFGPEGGTLRDTLSVEGHGAGTYYVDGVLAQKIGGKCEIVPNSKVLGEYTVAKDGQAGTGTVTLTVPKNTGEKDITYVVFEYAFKDKARKIVQASHADCDSKEQAVLVKAPQPVTPPSTPPVTPPVTPPLAQTGAQPGLLVGAGIGFFAAAFGLWALGLRRVRSRREDALAGTEHDTDQGATQ